jgi:hypothetical protein
MSPRDDDAVDPNAPLQENGDGQELRPFRLHAGVLRILALAAVALALPITLLVLGILDMRASRQGQATAEPDTPSTESLRLRMEELASERLAIEPLGDGRQKTIIHASRSESVAEILEALHVATRESGGSAVELGGDDAVRLLVSLPEEGVGKFQRTLAEITNTPPQDMPASATLHEITVVLP